MSFDWSDRLLLDATSLSEYLVRLISCGALEGMCVAYGLIHQAWCSLCFNCIVFLVFAINSTELHPNVTVLGA